MSYRRRVKGVHRPFADTVVAGERFCVCACEVEFHGYDAETVYLLLAQHCEGNR